METVTDVRPGVIVQEMALPEERGTAEGSTSTSPEIVRMKAGPAELQIPGRLSRSAYKVIPNSLPVLELKNSFLSLSTPACVGCAHSEIVEAILLWWHKD